MGSSIARQPRKSRRRPNVTSHVVCGIPRRPTSDSYGPPPHLVPFAQWRLVGPSRVLAVHPMTPAAPGYLHRCNADWPIENLFGPRQEDYCTSQTPSSGGALPRHPVPPIPPTLRPSGPTSPPPACVQSHPTSALSPYLPPMMNGRLTSHCHDMSPC
ncbi:hypothetical protein CGRA01v4_11364 [Colletotrichum graminicola]|nr:hypothetical protein CGRA01v4_11364 [Colletotrichum graminicola]